MMILKRSGLSAIFVAAAMALMLGNARPALAATGPRCYVDIDATGGANSGNTWANAYTDLQSALTDSNCDEIWVAEGLYKPTGNALDRTASFEVASGVELYGGFAGTEVVRSQRQPTIHITVLSGDIDNNDTTDLNGVVLDWTDITGSDTYPGTNSFHVVHMNGVTTPVTSSTVLDGFVITAGQADASGYECIGGGLFCDGTYYGKCSPTLANLTFSGNLAWWGGGMINFAGDHGDSSPSLTNIVFTGNRAINMGGAIFNQGVMVGVSSPTLTHVVFNNNSSEVDGGAMVNDGVDGTSNPVMTDVTFSGNQAIRDGGAMYNIGTDAGESLPTLINVTFFNNSAESGAAIYNDARASPSLTNVTFNHNVAEFEGGAMYNDQVTGVGNPSLTNVIMWGDEAIVGSEIRNYLSTTTISYSVVQGSGGSGSGWDASLGIDGGGNLDADPVLGTLQDNGGATQTMALGAGSSAIDSGTGTGCPNIDQRGVTRPQDGDSNGTATCDIGAYEVASIVILSGNAGVEEATLSYEDGTSKTVTSDAYGYYSIFVPSGWTGSVTPTKTGYTFDPTSRTYADPVTQNQPAQDFTATPLPLTIAGNAGLAGAMLTYTGPTGDSIPADGDGNYSIPVWYGWTGSVTPSSPGYAFDPPSRAYADPLVEDQTAQDYTAALIPLTITGNTGVGGVTLSYDDGGPQSVLSDTAGDYTINVLSNWTGTVTPTKTGYTFDPASRAYADPLLQDQTAQDYAATPIPLTISGSAGFPGVVLTYSGTSSGSTITDANGNYAIVVWYGWSGAVAPSLGDCTFDPPDRSYTVITADQTLQDFAPTCSAATFASIAAQDGWIRELKENSETGGTMNTTGSLRVGDNATDKQFKSVLSFDTSALPDDAILLDATLQIKRLSVTGSDPFNTLGGMRVDIQLGSFGKPSLQLADFQRLPGEPGVALFANTPVDGWYSASLTSLASINKSGLTQMRLQFESDDNDNGLADFLTLYSGNATAPGDRPVLVITYALP